MAQIILFAPLIGALIAGFGWRMIGETAAQWVATGLLFLSCLLSWVVFVTLDASVVQHIHILDFIRSGTLDTAWAIRLDRLTAIMLIVVTSVSALVHLYSFGYMAHDDNWDHHEHYKARFFAYLSFFTFAMLMLVTSDNLVQMFFGWEGVGVASYLLQEDINDIEVEAEQVIPEEDWKVVDEEAKPKKILQKGPSEHRVLFTDGSTRKVSKDDNIIRYL